MKSFTHFKGNDVYKRLKCFGLETYTLSTIFAFSGLGHIIFHENNFLFLIVFHNDLLESTVIFVGFRQCFFIQSPNDFVMIIPLIDIIQRKTLRQTARQGQMAGKNVLCIIFQKRVRGLHQVSKRKKHLPAFVFERLET